MNLNDLLFSNYLQPVSLLRISAFVVLWATTTSSPFRFRYRVETHKKMEFAVCLSMTEKAELNIHKTSHFSQFRAITMLIIHTVSAGIEQQKNVEDRTHPDQPQLVSFCCWWQSHFHSSFVHPDPPRDCWKDWNQYNSQNNQHWEELWESWTEIPKKGCLESNSSTAQPHYTGVTLPSSTWRISCQF